MCSIFGKAPSLSGPSGPQCPGECPTGCRRKWGCVPRGVSGALRAPGLQSVKKVSRVSPECQDTFLTLSGHLFDTLGPGARRAPETPGGTLPRTPPPFRGHPVGTLSGTLRKTLLAGRGFPTSIFPLQTAYFCELSLGLWDQDQ